MIKIFVHHDHHELEALVNNWISSNSITILDFESIVIFFPYFCRKNFGLHKKEPAVSVSFHRSDRFLIFTAPRDPGRVRLFSYAASVHPQPVSGFCFQTEPD